MQEPSPGVPRRCCWSRCWPLRRRRPGHVFLSRLMASWGFNFHFRCPHTTSTHLTGLQLTQLSPLQLFTYAANTTVILTPKIHQDALNFILIHKTPSELRMKSCTHTRSTSRAVDHSTTPKLPYFLVDSSSTKAPVGRPLMNQKCASPVTTNSSRDAETVSGG